jgi:hypothetical protein
VEFLPGKTYAVAPINGLKVPFRTNLTLRRVTKTNKVRVGGMMFRYAKDKPLGQITADYQSATILGLLRDCAIEEGAELSPDMCMTLCGVTSSAHPAPSNAVTRFNNTKAAAATIADAWPNVKAPKGAVL